MNVREAGVGGEFVRPFVEHGRDAGVEPLVDALEFVEAGGYGREALWELQDWRWRAENGVGHPLFWEREGERWLWRGMWERFPLPESWPVYVSQPVRPDSHYGASKAIGEVFGRYYYDAFGLEFISLRIGWFTEREALHRMRDHAILRAMWLGPKDMVNVTIGAIEAAVPFGI